MQPDGDDDRGTRFGDDALVALADKMDAECAAIEMAHNADVAAATAAIAQGAFETAAGHYDNVAAALIAKGFRGTADMWQRRARDCREAGRLRTRATKKGRKGRAK